MKTFPGTSVPLTAGCGLAKVALMSTRALRFRLGFGTRLEPCAACKQHLPAALLRHGVCPSPVCLEEAALARSSSMGTVPELAQAAVREEPAQAPPSRLWAVGRMLRFAHLRAEARQA